MTCFDKIYITHQDIMTCHDKTAIIYKDVHYDLLRQDLHNFFKTFIMNIYDKTYITFYITFYNGSLR